ncbi:helix-turn-helix transcriptional regulator [Streptomyces sp. NPDC026672]|uniref:helix-turn-helix domain-containing protein n=1 Tax=unclassified Streptomyces TaxID=2593676 RepID=UPI0033F9B811
MAGATGAAGADAFAELLRELKDRSGLSYGVLAKRLHMSTSTLHRYCNGTAVPVEYGPVERLARACRATPEELVELHRRWILADATRGRGTDQTAGPAGGPTAPAPVPAAATTASAAPLGQTEQTQRIEETRQAEHDEAVVDESVVVDVTGGAGAAPSPGRRRRTVLVACAAAVVVLGAAVLAVQLPGGGGGKGPADQVAAGGTAPVTGTGGPTDTGKPSTPSSPSAKDHEPSASAPASPAAESEEPGAAEGGSRRTAGPAADDNAVPLTVGTRPYVYDSPCSQHFLVDSEPGQVGPPAGEQDAPRWAAAYGAVSSGEQRVALTVQGTGAETVVLEALHVRILSKGAPLAWNDYAMGVGCGGGVETRSFDVALDAGSPAATVKNGQRDFPYKVSESDPEVFYVTAHSTAHDVRWDLTLDWSSGTRHGTVHIDDNGTPFRTSADADRPGYDYPLGGGEWIERMEG